MLGPAVWWSTFTSIANRSCASKHEAPSAPAPRANARPVPGQLSRCRRMSQYSLCGGRILLEEDERLLRERDANGVAL